MGDAGWLRDHVRDIPDFPKPGVVFKDITPLFADVSAMSFVIDALTDAFADSGIDKVLGIEARGFIVGAPVAYRLGAGFVPIRKAGKLPWQVEKEQYVLEYGTDLLEIHRDAVRPGERVAILDDVLATGGTAAAAVRLAGKLGAFVAGVGCVLELGYFDGRAQLGDTNVVSLVTYE